MLQNAKRSRVLSSSIALTLLAAASAAAQTPPQQQREVLESVIVTAQKTEERLIDVPIAVSAFTDEALERRQIDQATDLQLNIPNVSYSKTNFTSSNFQIRGIGVSSVGASSDSGVETHFNSMPIKSPRLFETEYFDVERVEVLRGPQGTLYGRNATGGAINVIARKPTDEFGGNFEVEGGDYNSRKVKGAVNIPLGETLSARFAGLWFERDGYTYNEFTGNDVDGRDQWAARGSLRFTPSEATDVTLTVNYYEEDSTRARTLKQLCNTDPTGAYGCLPDRLDFGVVNGRGTLGGTLAELLPLVLSTPSAPVPALVALGTNLNQGAVNPRDLRRVSAEFDPTYVADETIATLEISHSFSDFTLTSITGYQETMFVGTTDYNWNSPTGPYNGPALALLFGGAVPLSQLPSPNGSLSGDIRLLSDRSTGYDRSDQKADQFSQELRLSSDFDGAWNFQLGAFYFDAETDDNYSIATTELDYAGNLLRSQTPYYINATPSAAIESTAVFGELYYDMSEAFRWTLGLRYTRDDKSIKDRQLLLSVPFPGPLPEFRVDDTNFEEVTGRFGFDWKPGYGNDSTIYAFYSRGYKAGGFNPPLDEANPAFIGTPRVYDPEFVNAFEVGSKNLLADGRLQANFSAFYYDYENLQVSKIVARTSVNENIQAGIWGVEGEFVFSPVDPLTFDLNLAYLNTEIKDTQSIDPRDPSNGNPAFTVVKDVSTAANYVVPTAAIPLARGAGCLLPAALGGPFGLLGVAPACAPFFSDGVPADLSGNQLAGAPEWSAKLGAQYVFNVGDYRLTTRADYYWRDDFYARIFNRPIDKVESWDVLNAQVEFSPSGREWYVRGFVNNVMDDDNITGMYVTDASSGLFTNVFALEPRTWGVAVGFRFGE